MSHVSSEATVRGTGHARLPGVQPVEDRPLGVWSASLTALTAILWAGTAIGSRIAADTIPPMMLGALRFASTLVILWLWCLWEGSRLKLSREAFVPVLILGLMLFAQISTFNLGIAWSSSSHASVIINTYLFGVAGYEHFITRTHRLRLLQLLGMLIAFSGVVLLFQQTTTGNTAQEQQDPATLFGDLMLLISSLLLAIKVIYTKHAVRTIAPGSLMLWHNVVGTLLFLAGGLMFEDLSQMSFPATTIWSLLYIGPLVSGFCFAAHAWLLRHHSAGSVSVYSFLTPVFGVWFASLLRGDLLTGRLLLCGLCVAGGIILIHWQNGRSSDLSPAEQPAKDCIT